MRTRFTFLFLAIPPFALGWACGSTPPPAAPATPATEPAAQVAPPPAMSIPPGIDPGFDPTAIDHAANPCHDFYQFACGKWIERTPIPPDRPGWSRSFSEINERNQEKLKEILEAYAAGKADPADVEARKVGDFYATCMDEAKAETESRKTLDEQLARVDALKDAKGMAKLVADLHLAGVNAFFGFGQTQDFKDATQVIGEADQAGLGLPDRDYYFNTDEKSQEIRKLYVEHVAKMLELAGAKPAASAAQAATVMEIETALAKGSMTRVDRRDPNKVYHRIERAGLQKKAPDFGWKQYFEALGTPTVTALNVAAPEFFVALSSVLKKKKLPDLKTYLRWHVIAAATPTLGQAFVDEDFHFSSTALTGAKQILPRWKRCATATNGALGEALAKPFVRETFGEDGKAKSVTMIKAIEGAFEGNLETLAWMDPATRQAAGEKARAVMNKIGYPDKWRDYSRLEIDRGSYLANVMRANVFESRRQLDKIGKPVDRAEWLMTPPIVNAYYNSQLNEMVFPAGILQPPFFTRKATDAVNFGAIGMVMGHELTHGFDDSGRQFDAVGNLRDWWAPAVGEGYKTRAECVAKLYDGFDALPGLKVNGHLTLGENIADLGGLKLAHTAAMANEKQHPSPEVAGFSPEQQFFLAFAQGWCSNRREEYSRMLQTTDPHSPPQHRVNGPASQFPAFADAWQCAPGTPMAPKDRCTVW